MVRAERAGGPDEAGAAIRVRRRRAYIDPGHGGEAFAQMLKERGWHVVHQRKTQKVGDTTHIGRAMAKDACLWTGDEGGDEGGMEHQPGLRLARLGADTSGLGRAVRERVLGRCIQHVEEYEEEHPGLQGYELWLSDDGHHRWAGREGREARKAYHRRRNNQSVETWLGERTEGSDESGTVLGASAAFKDYVRWRTEALEPSMREARFQRILGTLGRGQGRPLVAGKGQSQRERTRRGHYPGWRLRRR